MRKQKRKKLLYTPQEAADTLSLSRSKVYDLMARGELHSIKIGGARRISRGALRSFVERKENRP